MYLKERIAFLAIIFTIPDSMHMWLTHNGEPFKKVWANEPLHWVLYDIYTLTVFTMVLFFIGFLIIKITFHDYFEKWQFHRNLKRYLKQDSVVLQLYFNAQQTGFDKKVFRARVVEKFTLKVGNASSEINGEIVAFFQLYNKQVTVEPVEEKFQIRVNFHK